MKVFPAKTLKTLFQKGSILIPATHTYIHAYIHTECNSLQYVFQSRNTYVFIDMKEEIWLPNENICYSHVTPNTH